MISSVKVQPTETEGLKASADSSGPGEENCLMQLAHIHKLRDSEANYDKHQWDLSMNMLRSRAGLAAPLIMSMELHAARKIGRLPFLQSSNLMEDVLLGRDELIPFGNHMNAHENNDYIRQPHAVVEKTYGF